MPDGKSGGRNAKPGLKRRLARIPHPHFPHLTLTDVRLLRLFGLLFVFAALVLYAVFRSERFQEHLRRKCERELSQMLHRRVKIGGFDLALVPPAFVVKDVWIQNDPRGIAGACFSAAEIELRGIPRFSERRIDLPKVRVMSPRVVLELFADGSSNLPTLPKAGGGPGVDVRLGEALLQRGIFRFREWKARLDLRLQDAAVTGSSGAFSRVTHASVACRRAEFRLEDNEVLAFQIGAEATLAPGRVHLDALRLRSDEINVDASGGIEDVAKPVIALVARAATTGTALDKLFGVGLPLEGDILATAAIRITPHQGFRIRGRFQIPNGMFGPFPMSGSGLVRVEPTGLLVDLTEGRYAGGSLQALVRLPRLDRPPLPIKILARGRDLSFEQFFGDIDLKGTGLVSRADLDTTLTFDTGRGGIEKADGVGSLRLKPVAGQPSLVRGRHALPTSGGGPLEIRRGKILFAKTPLHTGGGADVTVDGTLALGTWLPDFAITAQADDLAELERIADNFYPAIQKRPLSPPLKLGGSGRIEAHLTRSFGDPHVEGRLVASNFVLRGVRFGSSTANFLVDRNVLTLSPFESADAGGTLQVTGKIGWGGALGDHYLLDGLVASFGKWPIERVLAFLDIDLPLTGPVTGGLPLSGKTPAVTGSVPVSWEKAGIFGQRADRLEGKLTFESDGLVIEGMTAELDGGQVKGEGTYKYGNRAYTLSLAASSLPVSALALVASSAPQLSGLANGHLSGEGTIDKPRLTLEGRVTGPRWEGRPLGAGGVPLELTARDVDGDWSATAVSNGGGRAELQSANGKADVRLTVLSLAAFEPLLNVTDGVGLDGRFRLSLRLDAEGPEAWKKGEGTLEGLELTMHGKHLRAARAPFHLAGGRLVSERFALAEPASEGGAEPVAEVTLAGSAGLSSPWALDVAVGGTMDAALLNTMVSGAHLQGRLGLDLKLGGTLEKPSASGRVQLEGVDYLGETNAGRFESMVGTLTFAPERLTIDSVEAAYLGGTVEVAGTLGLKGTELDGIRLNAHLSHLKSTPFEGFRATVSGDLVLAGDTTIRNAWGDLTLDRGIYDQDIGMGLQSLMSKLRPGGGVRATASPTAFDAVGLDVRINAPPGSIEIRNNVFRIRGNGQLVARGTFGQPLLFGQIEAEDGGRLILREVKYEVLNGKILFSNPTRIDPYFELGARTTIRPSRSGATDYQVTLGLSGTLTQIVPRLSSDPALSEAQILSLILTGDLPGTNSLGVPVGSIPVSSDESIARATREFLASLVTQAAADRTKRFFNLDRLQIDPVFVGSSFDATRLTIGKQLSRDISVTYSYKTSATTPEQILVVEWEISRDAFVQFVRDELGVYSVDVKLRRRLR